MSHSRRSLYAMALLALLLVACALSVRVAVSAQEAEPEGVAAQHLQEEILEEAEAIPAVQNVMETESGSVQEQAPVVHEVVEVPPQVEQVAAAPPPAEPAQVQEQVPVVQEVVEVIEVVEEQNAQGQVQEVPVAEEVIEVVEVAEEPVAQAAATPEPVQEAPQAVYEQAPEQEQMVQTPEPAQEQIVQTPEPVQEQIVQTPEPVQEQIVQTPEPVQEQHQPEPIEEEFPPAEEVPAGWENAAGAHEQHAAPELRTGGSTVRWNSKVLPEGCAKATELYLRRIHEDRSSAAAAVADARAALNEARTQSSEHAVAKAEEKLQKATAALAAFDAETLKHWGGSLPKTCIDEVQRYMEALPESESESEFIRVHTHFFQLFMGHARTFALTAKGQYAYLQSAYAPMLKQFNQFADTYYKKAKELYNEAHPKPGLLDKITKKQREVPVSEFVLKTAKGLAYACVPLCLMGVVGVVVLALFPVIALGVVLPDLIYHVWVRTFFFYYTYGMTFPGDFITALQSGGAKLQDGKWNEVLLGLGDSMLELASDADEFYYNGFLMVFFVGMVLSVLACVLVCWLRCCCCRRRRSPKAAGAHGKGSKTAAKAAAGKKKN